MGKANPLFVDSTKLQGDCIGTQFELNNILVYDDEVLAVLVRNHQDKTVRKIMEYSDGSTFEARVLLSHQKPITYQFVVEKDGKVTYQSEAYSGRAQYAIISDWQPLEGSDLPPPLLDAPPPAPKPAPERELKIGADYALTIKALIEKWDL